MNISVFKVHRGFRQSPLSHHIRTQGNDLILEIYRTIGEGSKTDNSWLTYDWLNQDPTKFKPRQGHW
ncbi:uncharacterized protein LAJ45_09931 [Morchella importuna]|uniref:uncharacterized protein n=1 Tax=Morchella importuna TaxID=1174673 RepID=UPI001E8D8E49|nr:uncharacterized protein LAJ45_09931 [Morchella importuna]KAH8146009.1 hypothetical protein LAJ45_09931 [Morchella importuna]